MKPDFLIVGAMKAGTTTLYHDLARHPQVFMPAEKEPNTLVRLESKKEVLADYQILFRSAKSGFLKGEASTAYTKRPKFDGIAARAREFLGPQIKVIYIRRDAVARAISHYRHARQHGNVSLPFEQAVMQDNRFIDYGRYAWQIAPWIEAFGTENVFELELEQYSSARGEALAKVLIFLGLDPDLLRPVDPAAVHNSAGEQKFIPNPFLREFICSDLYQRRIKVLIPKKLRGSVRRAILPPPQDDVIDVSAEIARYIIDEAARSPELPQVAQSAPSTR